MASRIEAIIWNGDGRPTALPTGALITPLRKGLSMLLVTDDVAAALDPAAIGDDRINPHWMMRQPVAELARRVSDKRQSLYVVGESFAGQGIQEAIAWLDGVVGYGPSGTVDVEQDIEYGYRLVPSGDSAINAGLRAIGILATPGCDEYQAAGLTRYRITEDWHDTP